MAVMSYRNSSTYVQQMIDRILQPHCDFSRAYVDNIIIYTKLKSLNDHLTHLDKVFSSLTKKGICLSPKKSFLGYPTVQLLSQRVNALGLATAEDKLAAIVNIEFPRTLSVRST